MTFRCVVMTLDYQQLVTFITKVGTVCCRLETKDDQTNMYLMTMGILAVRRALLTSFFLTNSGTALSIQRHWISMPGVGNICCHRSNEAKNTQDIPTCTSIEWRRENFL